jgi:hypothetical protein
VVHDFITIIFGGKYKLGTAHCAVFAMLNELHRDPQIIPTKIERMQAQGLYICKAHIFFAI